MRIIRRLPGVLSTAVMVSCLVVTSVTAAPSQDSLEEQKSAAESEAEDLQAQLTELLDKVGKRGKADRDRREDHADTVGSGRSTGKSRTAVCRHESPDQVYV